MTRVTVFLICLVFVTPVNSLPTGIDDRGDDGCVCHGGIDDTTTVSITGLPEMYNSSQSYNFTLKIESPIQESQNMNDAKGGFRVIVSKGEIIGDGWQFIEGGYTHNVSINSQRTWNATWIAPSDDSIYSSFIIHGNAVNGNGESSGDEWNSNSLVVKGINFTGEVESPVIGSDEKYHNKDTFYIISGLGLFSLIVIIYFVSKD